METRERTLTRTRKQKKRRPWVTAMVLVVLAAAAITAIFIPIQKKDGSVKLDWANLFPFKKLPAEVRVPEWVEEALLPENEYSRPGTPLRQVNGVVIHYVGNPGTTAMQNRNYFAGLAETHDTYASSHFIVDTDGTVIQCVPLNEISYCSNYRNEDTIAIECCHPDESGKFTAAEIASLEKLLCWLIHTYDLEREDIIRHYDVTGKRCPRYYVDNEDAWEEFRDQTFEQYKRYETVIDASAEERTEEFTITLP